jgi:very-short-patch-repair endonuclease
LRREATDAEKLLWARLRNRRLGFKFKRQHPIGPFVADFCRHERALVIELDREQHAFDTIRDARRTAFLNENGYRVIRFWNYEILMEIVS